MKRFQLILNLAILTLALSCSSSSRLHERKPDFHLKKYNPISLNVKFDSGWIYPSFVKDMAGHGRYRFSEIGEVKESLELFFERLLAMGFDFVEDEKTAEAILELNLDSFRNHSQMGLIVDQAIVTFREPKSDKILASFRSNEKAKAEPLNKVFEALLESIKANY